MSEPSLREVQRWMRARIRPTGSQHVPGAAREVVLCPQRGVPGIVRLSIYATGFLARMREALAEAYPAIHHLLGEGRFRLMAEAYTQRYPSHEYNLSVIGRHLAEFLSTSTLTEQLPFLPDLARLEWRVQRAFHAEEEPPFDARALSSIPAEAWERFHLRFQPSVGVVSSPWPIIELWHARTQPVKAIDIDLLNRPQHAVVFRRGVTVACERIDSPQALLLQELLDGQPLGAACAHMINETSESELPPVTSWFARWSQAGLIAGCDGVQ